MTTPLIICEIHFLNHGNASEGPVVMVYGRNAQDFPVVTTIVGQRLNPGQSTTTRKVLQRMVSVERVAPLGGDHTWSFECVIGTDMKCGTCGYLKCEYALRAAQTKRGPHDDRS